MLKSLPFSVLSGVAGACLFGAAAAHAQDELCGQYPVGQSSYACTCTPDAAVGSVWGSGPYTADSSICRAALHAGMIGPDGGIVLVVRTEGQSSYQGSEANSVQTESWGAYDSSFIFDILGE